MKLHGLTLVLGSLFIALPVVAQETSPSYEEAEALAVQAMAARAQNKGKPSTGNEPWQNDLVNAAVLFKQSYEKEQGGESAYVRAPYYLTIAGHGSEACTWLFNNDSPPLVGYRFRPGHFETPDGQAKFSAVVRQLASEHYQMVDIKGDAGQLEVDDIPLQTPANTCLKPGKHTISAGPGSVSTFDVPAEGAPVEERPATFFLITFARGTLTSPNLTLLASGASEGGSGNSGSSGDGVKEEYVERSTGAGVAGAVLIIAGIIGAGVGLGVIVDEAKHSSKTEVPGAVTLITSGVAEVVGIPLVVWGTSKVPKTTTSIRFPRLAVIPTVGPFFTGFSGRF